MGSRGLLDDTSKYAFSTNALLYAFGMVTNESDVLKNLFKQYLHAYFRPGGASEPPDDIVKYACSTIATSHDFAVITIRFSIVENHIVGILNVSIGESTPEHPLTFSKLNSVEYALRIRWSLAGGGKSKLIIARVDIPILGVKFAF